MKPLHFFLFVFCLALTILSCPKTNKNDSPDESDQKEPGQSHEPYCIEFEGSPTVDSISDGESFLSTNLFARQHNWPINGYLKLDVNNFVGDGKNLKIYNIDLDLQFSSTISWIAFDFAELGGNNKIMVNNTSYNVADLVELQNNIIDGVGFSVDATQSGNNWVGSLVARGAIDHFALGGQELWIDNLCIDRLNVLIENRVNDPANNSTNPNGSLPQFNHFKALMDQRGIAYTDKVDGAPLDSLFMDQFDIYVWYISPISSVSPPEIDVIRKFAEKGGSVFILTESGNQMQFDLTEQLFNEFGATHGGNTIQHATNNWNNLTSHVIYQSNSFNNNLSNAGIQQVYAPIASTVHGVVGNWSTLIQTDAAAIPAGEPLLIHRQFGNGQVLISGDFSILFQVSETVGAMDNDILITYLLYFLSNQPL